MNSQGGRVDEELHPQVLINFPFTLSLCQTPQGVQVVGFHAVEIILRLGIDGAEDSIRISLAVDVRDAPVVADDGDVRCLIRPSRGLSRIEGITDGAGGEQQNQLLHER